MLIENGNQKLQTFAEKSYPQAVISITDGVWFVTGLGHSNAIFIEGTAGVILVDTLDTLERGEQLRQIIRDTTGKEVHTILYTHSHPDHLGGAGAFSEHHPEIISFAPAGTVLEHSAILQDIQTLRAVRQFGYSLTEEELISQGLGPREGIARGEHRAFVPPTTVYREEQTTREIDGVTLELRRLPGETDDQMAVWLPDKKVLCCGDNYYGCFPNLYAIRGGQYRDIAAWVHTLDILRSYPAGALLPGHTAAILGQEAIQQVLENYRNAIDFLLTRVLEGMNAGKDPDQLAHEIRLPEEYAALPYLGEFYGCVEWTVREIYAAYIGWFDGNPTHLHPLPLPERAQKSIALMGGRESVLSAAQAALQDKEYQWCLELCDLLLEEADSKAVSHLKAEAMLALAEYETNANGRHYYIACAKEILQKA